MSNSEILSTLFNEQNKFLFDAIFNKHFEMFVKLANHIKNKNMISLPFEFYDFESILINSLVAMKNVKPEMIERFTYLTILKKIFVQRIIALDRQFKTNKQKILNIASNNEEIINTVSDYEVLSNSDKYDLRQIYFKILNKLSKPIDKKIFNLYLFNKKPKEIALEIKKDVKFVYNAIFNIKKHCSEYLEKY